MPPQYSYSYVHGGDTDLTCPDDIKQAFAFIDTTASPQLNCDSSSGSAHDLKNIRGSMTGNWEWGDVTEEIDPCMGCHNPHRAEKAWPCSKPSGHENVNTWEIWGDESGEKMADYLSAGEIYEPPYKVGMVQQEPDADNQPNYVELCLECHQYQQNSFQHGTVTAIDWGTDVGMGKGASYFNFSGLKLPYLEANEGKYVLCCTDCHEPHGSRNEWLLRTTVNGASGIEINTSGYWWDLCTACHDLEGTGHGETPPGPVSIGNCFGGYGLDACHQHGSWGGTF
jgi:Zn-finger protein